MFNSTFITLGNQVDNLQHKSQIDDSPGQLHLKFILNYLQLTLKFNETKEDQEHLQNIGSVEIHHPQQTHSFYLKRREKKMCCKKIFIIICEFEEKIVEKKMRTFFSSRTGVLTW